MPTDVPLNSLKTRLSTSSNSIPQRPVATVLSLNAHKLHSRSLIGNLNRQVMAKVSHRSDFSDIAFVFCPKSLTSSNGSEKRKSSTSELLPMPRGAKCQECPVNGL